MISLPIAIESSVRGGQSKGGGTHIQKREWRKWRETRERPAHIAKSWMMGMSTQANDWEKRGEALNSYPLLFFIFCSACSNIPWHRRRGTAWMLQGSHYDSLRNKHRTKFKRYTVRRRHNRTNKDKEEEMRSEAWASESWEKETRRHQEDEEEGRQGKRNEKRRMEAAREDGSVRVLGCSCGVVAAEISTADKSFRWDKIWEIREGRERKWTQQTERWT